MEDKLNKLDELIDLATRLIAEQKEMAENNRQIVSEIDFLYQRINENNTVYLDGTVIGRCICDEEY